MISGLILAMAGRRPVFQRAIREAQPQAVVPGAIEEELQERRRQVTSFLDCYLIGFVNCHVTCLH